MTEAAAHWLAQAARLPTLTEVVEIGSARPPPEADGLPATAPVIDTVLLVEQVLAEIAPHVDALFEARLRGALAPAVARAVGGLLTESRTALSASLRVLVQDAVARAVVKVVAERERGP